MAQLYSEQGLVPEPRRSQGFTLVEVVVVMIIVAVLAAIALPRSDTDTVRLSAEAERLAVEIRYAQALGMTRGQPAWIRFSGNSGYGFFLSGAVAVPHPGGEANPTLQAGTSFSLSGLPNSLVAFNGLGTPYVDSTPVSTVLGSNADITVSRNAASRTVRIYSGTGLVRVCAVPSSPTVC